MNNEEQRREEEKINRKYYLAMKETTSTGAVSGVAFVFAIVAVFTVVGLMLGL